MSGLDATFLYMETARNYGHVGSLQIFAQPAVVHERTPEEDAANTEFLYGLASYTRRRLVEVPFGLDHPYWIEDPEFDREFHERTLAVPSPGTDRQLEQVVSRIASRPLDRSKPLWEVYRIEGVDGGRKFAVYSKTHHAAIDGASGTQIVLAPDGPRTSTAQTRRRPLTPTMHDPVWTSAPAARARRSSRPTAGDGLRRWGPGLEEEAVPLAIAGSVLGRYPAGPGSL